jgi:hypothetical protein
MAHEARDDFLMLLGSPRTAAAAGAGAERGRSPAGRLGRGTRSCLARSIRFAARHIGGLLPRRDGLKTNTGQRALTIFRTTYSGVLKDNMDYSTAMFDGSGKLAAQGLTLPGHLGSMPTAMAAIQEAFARRIESTSLIRRFNSLIRPN